MRTMVLLGRGLEPVQNSLGARVKDGHVHLAQLANGLREARGAALLKILLHSRPGFPVRAALSCQTPLHLLELDVTVPKVPQRPPTLSDFAPQAADLPGLGLGKNQVKHLLQAPACDTHGVDGAWVIPLQNLCLQGYEPVEVSKG
jgi:hypothetical protein